MRVITYSRVSTERDQNPAAQREELARYCNARGWKIVEDLVDHGFSGASDQRPALKQLLTLVRSRKCDCVVVIKLDRLARSLRHLVTLLDEFTALGIQFVSVNDQIDLTTASGRLMLHIIGAFAEFERALVRERTLAGLAHARRKGKRLGRPPTRDDASIHRLRSQGLSYRDVAERLGVSKGAIHRSVKGGTKSPKNRRRKDQSNQGEI